jgi:hypothetical protein
VYAPEVTAVLARLIVPLVVIVLPVKPVPAVIDVTVPGVYPNALVTCKDAKLPVYVPVMVLAVPVVF